MMPSPCIWLIGGTSESAAIAQCLVQQQIPCRVTVTTPQAVGLYPVAPCLTVEVGALAPAQLAGFIQLHQVRAIVDASHPHALFISQAAIRIAEQLALPYLRYERPEITTTNPPRAQSWVTTLPDWEQLLAGNHLTHQRVLLIIGYRQLQRFAIWHDRATLFARILPSPIALAAAQAAGFDPRRLIALRPPITPELEAALWRQWQISLVVAKASGAAGGEDVKQQVARQLQIPLLLIARPPMIYPQQSQDLSTIVAFCHQHLKPV
ncbi:MAG: cobalt-precorrin-6A reductase [Cyanobacteria bacterium P01_G01_bin.54]